jgi:Domain of unknown function (DUF4411)
MAYLLDANVFIEAKNRYYGFDFCPAFWDWLIRENESQIVFSIDRISDEIKAGTDELVDWVNERGAGFFVKPDSEMMKALGVVSTWATSQDYEQAAVSTFLEAGDLYLVAHALAHRHTVVTHELFSNSKKKIQIPNACIPLDIKCVSTWEMLRNERARFVLGAKV